ncbi:uncharacterized protein BO97DRAFT_92879 [Aspergillus homomorphus CBS 101889]|uniref:Uncharacterized protein n=1 Tax=Aspergillus homomorphus (strain CBS 101889) TaxID=1450537 RepID=A0A395HUT4_ASPHC|nr:hypothetical protein BO97DRAFT_92879 [Aspergillus homomorphus CBS 101889]RAL11681.1 hypothetical protein BO97DRAFT_92879 [Aspergillus homomorphus CBS 101889]
MGYCSRQGWRLIDQPYCDVPRIESSDPGCTSHSIGDCIEGHYRYSAWKGWLLSFSVWLQLLALMIYPLSNAYYTGPLPIEANEAIGDILNRPGRQTDSCLKTSSQHCMRPYFCFTKRFSRTLCPVNKLLTRRDTRQEPNARLVPTRPLPCRKCAAICPFSP